MLPRKSLKSQARVLFVDNDVNSFYSYRIEMALAARDAGFDVHIACPPGKAVEILLNEGFTFHPIPMTRSGLTPWKELGTIVALFRLYRKLRPDLVHHLRLKPVLYGGLAAYGAGVPAVVGLLTGLGYVFTAETRKAIVLRKLVTWSCKVAFRRGNQRVIFQNPDDRFIFVENQILPAHKTVLIKGSAWLNSSKRHVVSAPRACERVSHLWAKPIQGIRLRSVPTSFASGRTAATSSGGACAATCKRSWRNPTSCVCRRCGKAYRRS